MIKEKKEIDKELEEKIRGAINKFKIKEGYKKSE